MSIAHRFVARVALRTFLASSSGFSYSFRRLSDGAKQEAGVAAENVEEPYAEERKTFIKLLRNSKLLQLGGVDGRVVIGRIVHTMQDDLYIDFGGKFNAVCKRPRGPQSRQYILGAKVLLKLHDLELSSRFLGSDKDLTLLEADATLIGLHDYQGGRFLRSSGRVKSEGDKSSSDHVKSILDVL